MNPAHITITL